MEDSEPNMARATQTRHPGKHFRRSLECPPNSAQSQRGIHPSSCPSIAHLHKPAWGHIYFLPAQGPWPSSLGNACRRPHRQAPSGTTAPRCRAQKTEAGISVSLYLGPVSAMAGLSWLCIYRVKAGHGARYLAQRHRLLWTCLWLIYIYRPLHPRSLVLFRLTGSHRYQYSGRC